MKYYDAFGEGGYHSAFFTTFAFSGQAFEDIPFPKLRGAGCRNITVLADASMVNLSFAEFGTPRFAGSLYHLIKIAAPGAFHPKIVLLVGENKGRLLVGSANLTALGLAGNRELVADLAYSPAAPAFAPVFRQALDYISTAAPSDDPWFAVSRDRALQLSPWLLQGGAQATERAIDDLELIVDSPMNSVLEQIVAAIGGDEIERLVVVSPYWDTELEGLRLLREEFGSPPTDILIEKSRGQFPISSFSQTSGIGLFDIENGSRFNHAKLIVAIGREFDHVVSGSLNCTVPALLGSRVPKGNAEAGIYKRVPVGAALPALGLADYRDSPIEPSSLVDPSPSDIADESYPIEPGIFQLRGTRLTWIPPSKLPKRPTHLAIFDSNGANHWGALKTGCPEETGWNVDLELGRPRSARVYFVDDASAPGFVIDLDLLITSTSPTAGGKKDRLADRLAIAGREDLELIGVLTDLETIDLDEIGNRETRFTDERENRDGGDATRSFLKLTYEDFVKARSRTGADRDAKSFSATHFNRAADLVSSCLNRLIGLVSKDLSAEEEAELQKTASHDLSVTEPRGQGGGDADDDGSAPAQKESAQRVGPRPREYSTKIVHAVIAFEARTRALRGQPITTAELVRLRALLQIILAYAQPLGGAHSIHGILPVTDKTGHDWPRLAGRLLNQHFGTILALQHLRLEEDENERLRILEYLAIAFFASQAANQAADTRPKSDMLRNSLAKLATGIAQQVNRVVDAQADDRSYFWQLVRKLDERFSEALGLKLISEAGSFLGPACVQPSAAATIGDM